MSYLEELKVKPLLINNRLSVMQTANDFSVPVVLVSIVMIFPLPQSPTYQSSPKRGCASVMASCTKTLFGTFDKSQASSRLLRGSMTRKTC